MVSQEGGLVHTAPVPSASEVSEASGGLELVTEALLTEFMADEEAVAELQSILADGHGLEDSTVDPTQEPSQPPLSAPVSPKMDSEMAVVQEAVDSTPHGQGVKRQRKAEIHNSAENVFERGQTLRLNEDRQRQGLHAGQAQMMVAQHPPLAAGCWVHCWPYPLGTHVQPHLPVACAQTPPAGSLGHGQVNMHNIISEQRPIERANDFVPGCQFVPPARR